MARPRKKKRTQLGSAIMSSAAVPTKQGNRDPKSMVIRIGAGEVGPSISQLVRDVRGMMEPGTASRLKERRSNRLRDYTAMAGPLGVSHLLLFSRSKAGNINLRLALAPRGPTLNFRVEEYSLTKDVKRGQKYPRTTSKDYLTSPLLVMNNFNSMPASNGTQNPVPQQLESLMISIFQSLFPPISAQDTPLSSIRRVLLLNHEPSEAESQEYDGACVLDLRHYAIVTEPVNITKGVRRLNTAERLVNRPKKQKKNLPNLGKLEDVADYILDPSTAASGFTSASGSETDTDAEVEVLHTQAAKIRNQREMAHEQARSGVDSKAVKNGAEKRAVRLVELGPRLRLRLTKVEENVCGGKVMWHEYIRKTPEELRDMDETWEKRREENEKRRRLQRANIEKKRAEKHRNGTGEEPNEGSRTNGHMDVDELDVDEWDTEAGVDLP